MMKKLFFFLISLFLYSHSVFASCTVYLKRGNTFTGKSCEVTNNTVYLNTGSGRMWWYEIDVAAVNNDSLSRNQVQNHQERNRAERSVTTPPSYSSPDTTPKTNYSDPSTTIKRYENGRIERSSAAKYQFMKATGYPNGRPGYVVDHIIPLACGGADSPENMQWQTTEEAKTKDKWERKGCNNNGMPEKSNMTPALSKVPESEGEAWIVYDDGTRKRVYP